MLGKSLKSCDFRDYGTILIFVPDRPLAQERHIQGAHEAAVISRCGQVWEIGSTRSVARQQGGQRTVISRPRKEERQFETGQFTGPFKNSTATNTLTDELRGFTLRSTLVAAVR